MSENIFEFEKAVPFSENDVASIEKALCRRIPRDYSAFVRDHGAAYVGGAIAGSEGLSVMEFFPPEEVVDVLVHADNFLDYQVLPFACDEYGNPYVFDHDESVHFIDYRNGTPRVTRVADNLSDFSKKII